MVWWIRSTENSFGEWSVVDLVRNYRICHYNGEAHGGTHLHIPDDGPEGPQVPIDDPTEAQDVMHAYARLHDAFDLRRFQEVLAKWRSASKNI